MNFKGLPDFSYWLGSWNHMASEAPYVVVVLCNSLVLVMVPCVRWGHNCSVLWHNSSIGILKANCCFISQDSKCRAKWNWLHKPLKSLATPLCVVGALSDCSARGRNHFQYGDPHLNLNIPAPTVCLSVVRLVDSPGTGTHCLKNQTPFHTLRTQCEKMLSGALFIIYRTTRG